MQVPGQLCLADNIQTHAPCWLVRCHSRQLLILPSYNTHHPSHPKHPCHHHHKSYIPGCSEAQNLSNRRLRPSSPKLRCTHLVTDKHMMVPYMKRLRLGGCGALAQSSLMNRVAASDLAAVRSCAHCSAGEPTSCGLWCRCCCCCCVCW